MCSTYKINGAEVETLGELCVALNARLEQFFGWPAEYDEETGGEPLTCLDMDSCLCPVDWERMCADFNLEEIEEEWTGFSNVFRTKHWSDCAVHSEPAYPAGPCNCGAGHD